MWWRAFITAAVTAVPIFSWARVGSAHYTHNTQPITHTTLNTRISVYTHLPSSVITVHYYTAKYDKCDGKVWRLVDFFVFHDLLVRSRVMLHAAFQELKHTYKCFLGLLAMKFKLPIYILCFRIILFSIYIMPQINFMTLSPKGHFPKPLMFTLLINVSLKQHTRELRSSGQTESSIKHLHLNILYLYSLGSQY